jgi:hypothetical protein
LLLMQYHRRVPQYSSLLMHHYRFVSQDFSFLIQLSASILIILKIWCNILGLSPNIFRFSFNILRLFHKIVRL